MQFPALKDAKYVMKSGHLQNFIIWFIEHLSITILYIHVSRSIRANHQIDLQTCTERNIALQNFP